MPNGNARVLEYHFDEESGILVNDTSPNHLNAELKSLLANGTQVSAPTRDTGRMVGPALRFDGGSLLNVGDHPALGVTNFTVMAWVWYTWNGYPHPVPPENRMEIVEKVDSFWMNIRKVTAQQTIAALRVGYQFSANKHDIHRLDSTIAIPETTNLSNPIWTHVAATLEQSSGNQQVLRIYINGVENTSATFTGLPHKDTHPLIIGARYTPNNTIAGKINLGPDALFKGAIDEFRLYSKALSGSEIRSLLSDVYIRDNLSDEGVEPLVGGGISKSPDINHYPLPVADPQKDLGSPSVKNSDNLFAPIEFGQPNYIYIRLQNRGITPADANIDIYWTPASTLPSPNVWKPIGSLQAGLVVPGELKVVGPLVWDNNIPAKGNYCFVAVLGNSTDPKPDLSTILGVYDFINKIRNKNNVTWKNFQVENKVGGSQYRIYFEIRGWPRNAYECDLEINLTELPLGCETELRILKRLTKGAIIEGLIPTVVSKLYTRYAVTPTEMAALRNMPLKASDHTKSSLTITLPEETPDGAYDISIAQRINNHELGRITSRLVVGNFPFVANRGSGEVHKRNCVWAKKISARNRRAYTDVQKALQHSYNGCRFCLPEYDTG